MAFIKDIVRGENFQVKNWFKDIKDNPYRPFVGSFDPASTAMWNKILGKDDKPLLNQMGGMSDYTKDEGYKDGLDMGESSKLHDKGEIAAGVIAMFGAAGSAAGGGAAASGSGGSSAAAGSSGGGAAAGGGSSFMSKMSGILNFKGGGSQGGSAGGLGGGLGGGGMGGLGGLLGGNGGGEQSAPQQAMPQIQQAQQPLPPIDHKNQLIPYL